MIIILKIKRHHWHSPKLSNQSPPHTTNCDDRNTQVETGIQDNLVFRLSYQTSDDGDEMTMTMIMAAGQIQPTLGAVLSMPLAATPRCRQFDSTNQLFLGFSRGKAFCWSTCIFKITLRPDQLLLFLDMQKTYSEVDVLAGEHLQHASSMSWAKVSSPWQGNSCRRSRHPVRLQLQHSRHPGWLQHQRGTRPLPRPKLLGCSSSRAGCEKLRKQLSPFFKDVSEGLAQLLPEAGEAIGEEEDFWGWRVGGGGGERGEPAVQGGE